MNDEQERLRLALLEEFASAKERWTDVRLELGRRSNELQVGVSERNFQLILALVSISVAFLAIVIPITHSQNSTQSSSLLGPAIFSFAAAVIGVLQLFLTTWWDRKCIDEDGQWGLDTYGRYHKSASDIHADLYLGSIPTDKIKAYEDLFGEIGKETKDRAERRNKALMTRALNFLYYSFLVIFGIGFVSLLVAVLPS